MQLQKIESKIYSVRRQKIMLDYDLAILYKVETKNLNLAVKRNSKRFPKDFMFQLTKKEWEGLRLQIETSNGRGGTRYLPYAFTEQGVSMLSSVLRSEKAIDVNIAIMRAFVFVRQYALTHKELTAKLKELEINCNQKFKDVYDALNYLLKRDKVTIDQKNRRRIGFQI
jgi:hypothetical protein